MRYPYCRKINIRCLYNYVCNRGTALYIWSYAVEQPLECFDVDKVPMNFADQTANEYQEPNTQT